MRRRTAPQRAALFMPQLHPRDRSYDNSCSRISIASQAPSGVARNRSNIRQVAYLARNPSLRASLKKVRKSMAVITI
jgi:hypothetical protein